MRQPFLYRLFASAMFPRSEHDILNFSPSSALFTGTCH